MSSINDQLLLAVDTIIKDAEAKIDECLVDQFVDQVSKPNDDSLLWLVLGRVKSFMEHKSFVMLNQTRAFKIIHAAIVSTQIDTDKLKPHFESMWATVDIIIINDFTPAMTTLLTIFNHLWQNHKDWLTEAVIEPHIVTNSYRITGITDVVIFCLGNMNNYHAKLLAEDLLVNIIIDSEKAGDKSATKSHCDIIVKELELDSAWILNVIYRLSVNKDMKQFFKRNKISETLDRKAFKSLRDRKYDMTKLSKCLANTMDANVYLDMQIGCKSRRGAITFFAHVVDEELQRTSLFYLLRPLLLDTTPDNSYYTSYLQRIVHRLTCCKFIPVDEDRKQIQFSLSYLRDKICFLIDRKEQPEEPDQIPLGILTGSTLILFICCNTERPFYSKKLLDCCSLLKSLYVGMDCSLVCEHLVDLSFNPIDKLTEVIAGIDTSNQESKPLALGFISLMNTMLKYEKYDHSTTGKILETVAKQTEPDIVNECILLLIENPIIQKTDDAVALVWKIYNDHKSGHDNELLGNLCVLLLDIDATCDGSTKDNRVVQVIIDTLKAYITVTPTIEKIIDSLDQEYLNSLSSNMSEARETLFGCIASAVGSEISNKTRCKALQLLGREPDDQDERPEIFKDVKDIMSIARDINSYEKISHSISDCY